MKTAFIYLAIVNAIDLFITLAGLELGFIKEANPLMKSLYEWTPVAFIGVKLMFSLLMLCMVFLIPLKTTKILKGVTFAACILYTFVMVLHSTWIFHATI
ncbi:hypothetical protein J9317_12695 [Metabacillus sp. KIGAM252]|uniref:DUF5658 domain-containing protein n=1 Tax=Metabacillus flavus TaxID=2823519 RepID=A0ABS5LFW9_9BACI|nr:DUF5658 family protein [Metabacillus flavus]MBS2969624.1 hypothetical protein [Metabacillus flavus]